MNLSDFIFSDDYFFIAGISALLTPDLIDENYYIVDVDSANLSLIKKEFLPNRKIVAFISNDLDYYALRKMKNTLFIDRRCRLKEILSCLLVNNARYSYRVKYALSSRESEVLGCLQKGFDADETSARLNMTMKTFYAHRRSLIFKLQMDNRISLYSNIARTEFLKKTSCESELH